MHHHATIVVFIIVNHLYFAFGHWKELVASTSQRTFQFFSNDLQGRSSSTEMEGNAYPSPMTSDGIRPHLDDDGKAFYAGNTARNPLGLLITGDRATVWCGNRWCLDLSIVATISGNWVW